MNLKHIAATLAILGSASFTMTGCKKSGEGTETPDGGGDKAKEGSCGGAKKDGAEGSCGGAKGEGGGEGGEGGEAKTETPA